MPPVANRMGRRIRQSISQPGKLATIGTSRMRAMEAGLSEHALELVMHSPGRLGWLGGCLPPLCPAVAGPTVGEEGDSTEHGYNGG